MLAFESKRTGLKNKIMFIIVITLAIMEFNNGHSITLFPENPTYKTVTFASGKNSVIFQSVVNVSEDTIADIILSYEVKSVQSSTYDLICYIALGKCDTLRVLNCRCTFNENERIFEVVINMTAASLYSTGLIRGTLAYHDTTVTSEVLNLPKIVDLPIVNNDDVAFFINDKKIIDYQNCKETTENDFVILVYSYHSSSQILLEIIENNTAVQNGSNILVQKLSTKEEKTIVMNQKDTQSSIILNSFLCKIQTASKKDISKPFVQDSSPTCTVFIIILSIAVLCLLMFSIINYRRKQSRQRTSHFCYQPSNSLKQINEISDLHVERQSF